MKCFYKILTSTLLTFFFSQEVLASEPCASLIRWEKKFASEPDGYCNFDPTFACLLRLSIRDNMPSGSTVLKRFNYLNMLENIAEHRGNQKLQQVVIACIVKSLDEASRIHKKQQFRFTPGNNLSNTFSLNYYDFRGWSEAAIRHGTSEHIQTSETTFKNVKRKFIFNTINNIPKEFLALVEALRMTLAEVEVNSRKRIIYKRNAQEGPNCRPQFDILYSEWQEIKEKSVPVLKRINEIGSKNIRKILSYLENKVQFVRMDDNFNISKELQTLYSFANFDFENLGSTKNQTFKDVLKGQIEPAQVLEYLEKEHTQLNRWQLEEGAAVALLYERNLIFKSIMKMHVEIWNGYKKKRDKRNEEISFLLSVLNLMDTQMLYKPHIRIMIEQLLREIKSGGKRFNINWSELLNLMVRLDIQEAERLLAHFDSFGHILGRGQYLQGYLEGLISVGDVERLSKVILNFNEKDRSITGLENDELNKAYELLVRSDRIPEAILAFTKINNAASSVSVKTLYKKHLMHPFWPKNPLCNTD